MRAATPWWPFRGAYWSALWVTLPAAKVGGRSARVRAAVLAATLEAVSHNGADSLSIPDIARTAGVHETSIYRRWGSRENLVLDALLTYSQEQLPIPDTGSLREDLMAFVRGPEARCRLRGA